MSIIPINWLMINDVYNVLIKIPGDDLVNYLAFQDKNGDVFRVDNEAKIEEFTIIDSRPVCPKPIRADDEFDYINWDVVPELSNVLVECNLGRVYAVQHTNGTCIDGLTGAEIKEYRVLTRRPAVWQSFTDDTDLSVTTSQRILAEAGETQVSRGVTYDSPKGERSMGKTVAMFNIHTGFNLTEEQGWQFMELLKMVRSGQGDFKLDNYVDGTSYASLAGESAARDRGNNS